MGVQADKRPPVNKPAQERIIDFSGGQNSTISGGLLNKGEAQKAINLSLEQKGTILPARGRKKRYNSTFNNQPCTGISGYYKKDGTSRLLIASGDKVYADKPHLSYKWDTQSDFEKSGASVTGFANTTKEPGKVSLKKYDEHFIHQCEDTTTFIVKDVTLTNDANNFYYRDKAIKATIDASKTVGYAKLVEGNGITALDVTKYYLITAMIKNGNATAGIRLVTMNGTDTVVKSASYVTGTAYVQTSMKLAPADVTALTQIAVEVNGAATQYAYFDGLMILQISEADYNNAGYVVPKLDDVVAVKQKVVYDTLSAWNTGTINGLVVNNNALELGYVSPKFTDVDTVDADWNGTKTQTRAVNNQLILDSLSAVSTFDSLVVNSGTAHSVASKQARPQRLADGTWVVLVHDTTMNSSNGAYKLYSSPDGNTWTLALTITDVNTGSIYRSDTGAIASYGNSVYILLGYDSPSSLTHRLLFYHVNMTTFVKGTTWSVSQGSILEQPGHTVNNPWYGTSIAVSRDGKQISAVWSRRDNVYTSPNLQYIKGTINADGSVTWGSKEVLSISSDANIAYKNPCVVYSNSRIHIIYEYYYYDEYHIKDQTKDIAASTWSTNGSIHWLTSYPQYFPSAVYVPPEIATKIDATYTSGMLAVAFYGTDASTAYFNIKFWYSTTDGASWAAMSAQGKLTNNTSSSNNTTPSITYNNNGELFILFTKETPYYNVCMLKFSAGAWGAYTNVTNINTGININTPVTCSNYNEFTSPITVWSQASTTIKFYGTFGSQAYYLSGSYTSLPITANIANARASLVKYTTTTPAGTTLAVQTNVSLDNGTTWLGWKAATNNTAIADVPLTGDLTNGVTLQYKIDYTTTDDKVTPTLDDITFELTPAKSATGTWVSPEIDTSKFAIQSSVVECLHTLNGGGVSIETSVLNIEGVWTDFVPQPIGTDLVATGDKMKLKITLTAPADLSNTPSVTYFAVAMNPLGKKGSWISDPIDISTAIDKSLGNVTISAFMSSGQLIAYSRSRASINDPWSAWASTLSDGTLRHPVNNFVQLRVDLSGDSLLDDITVSFDGTPAAEPILSGMTPDAEYDFTTLRDRVILANGHDALRKWDAVGTPAIIAGSPPIMKMVETHHNRVWGVEFDNPSRVRYSDILDPETWGVLNFIDFNPEDGDAITALYRYGQSLIVSKRRSMAMLTGNTSSNYSVVWLDNEQGAMGMKSITQADKYIAYVSYDGVRFTDLNTSVLATERLIPDWEELNHKRLNQACVVYWKNNLLVSLPSKNSMYNDQVWVFDFLRNAWIIRKGWNVSAFTKFHQYGEEILLAADSVTGQVYNVMTMTRYDDNTPVEYQWTSKRFDFGYPERYKLFKGIFLDIEGITEENTLVVNLLVDDVVVGTYTTAIPAGDGAKHTRRILPPLYNAVLGKNLTLDIKGRCGIQAITIEYIVRGVVPTDNV